jgi:hypothetical protein
MPDEVLDPLTGAQRDALSHSSEIAASREVRSHEEIRRHLRDASVSSEAFDAALDSLQRHGRIVLHFHPDRLTAQSMTVAEGLLADGIYRNQFETGITSGSRSARPGGDRDRWERQVFGGAYHREGVTARERPRYGSLEVVRFPDGPTPRFGSCYFVLRPSVSHRSTFTFMGTEEPKALERLGTISRLQPVIVPLLSEIAAGATAKPPWPPFHAPTLGVPGLTIRRLIDLLHRLADSRADPRQGRAGRVLDTTIEAQVHGIVDLRRDVELLVADPSFRDLPTGAVLGEIGARYEFPVLWHCGFQMRAADVPDNFRGPAMPPLAKRIARDDMIDARIIGVAVASLHQRPEAWADWGEEQETWQQLKQLWHVLVHFGSSRQESG